MRRLPYVVPLTERSNVKLEFRIAEASLKKWQLDNNADSKQNDFFADEDVEDDDFSTNLWDDEYFN